MILKPVLFWNLDFLIIKNKYEIDWELYDFKTLSKTMRFLKHHFSKISSLQKFPDGGSFIYAGGKEVSPLDTFILSSNEPVQITEPSRLDFFVYQAGIKGRFRVCIDSLVDCALVLKGSDLVFLQK